MLTIPQPGLKGEVQLFTKYWYKSHAPGGVYIEFKRHVTLVSTFHSGINFLLTYKANMGRKVTA